MITTGSKYFFGLAAFAFVAALVYGASTSGHQMDMDTLIGVISLGYKGTVGDQFGYTMLIGLFAVSLFLGCVSSAFRDADPEAAAQLLQLDTVPETAAPQGVSYWPVIGAFGATVLMLGFVASSALVVFGALILGVTAFEWAGRAWSERATGDPAVNRAIRNRVLTPVEIPLLAVVGIAVLVLSVSRVLLALPKVGSYLVFGLVPALILLVGWYFTAKPKVNKNLATALLLVAGLVVLAGGIAGAAHGPRDVEEKEGSSHEGGLRVIHPGEPVHVTSEGHPA